MPLPAMIQAWAPTDVERISNGCTWRATLGQEHRSGYVPLGEEWRSFVEQAYVDRELVPCDAERIDHCTACANANAELPAGGAELQEWRRAVGNRHLLRDGVQQALQLP